MADIEDRVEMSQYMEEEDGNNNKEGERETPIGQYSPGLTREMMTGKECMLFTLNYFKKQTTDDNLVIGICRLCLDQSKKTKKKINYSFKMPNFATSSKFFLRFFGLDITLLQISVTISKLNTNQNGIFVSKRNLQ